MSFNEKGNNEDILKDLSDIEILFDDILKYFNSVRSEKNFNSWIKERDNSKSIIFNYEVITKELKGYDISVIEEKTLELKEYVNYLIEDINDKWDKSNVSYKEYLVNESNTIVDKVKNIETNYNSFINDSLFISLFKNSYDIMNNLLTDNEHVLSYFSDEKCNFVILGRNGSGKTTLLNYLNNNLFNNNSYFIPANRKIDISEDFNIIPVLDDKTFKQIFNNDNSINNLIIILKEKNCIELENNDDECENEFGKRSGKTVNGFVKLFNSLSIGRKIKYEGGKVKLYDDNIEEYDIYSASDGEKSIIQIIIYVLLCPSKCFLFIDEPDEHLNSALLCKLFNELEKIRKDIVFIYCTHNIEFIESRSNAKFILLNGYNGKSWIIKKLEDNDNLDKEILIDIIGTKKDIIFIEGKYGSIDYRLYSALFDNFKIIPVDSCEKVINNCKDMRIYDNREYFGIIDNDFRSSEVVSSYCKDNIEVLKYNEIENLIASLFILEYVCKKENKTDKIEEIKKDIIKKLNNNKDGILKDYVKKIYPYVWEKPMFKDINDISNTINQNCEENKKKIISSFDAFKIKIDKLLNDNNYEEIVKFIPNKGTYLSSIKKYLKLDEDEYLDKIIRYINDDSEFKNDIIKQNFYEIYKSMHGSKNE